MRNLKPFTENRGLIALAVFLLACAAAFPQYMPTMPPGLPPEAMQALQGMFPGGASFWGASSDQEAADFTQNPAPLPQPASTSFLPLPTASSRDEASGQGGTPLYRTTTLQEREAAVAAVDMELDTLQLILPSPANAPSRTEALRLARSRSEAARRDFSPADTAEYGRIISWAPRFDGSLPDPAKAAGMSFLVSMTSTYLDKPHFIIALAAAGFALDPESPTAAGNFGSAVMSAGERLFPGAGNGPALDPFRRDAESLYLYAIAASMRRGAWTEKSLVHLVNLGNLHIDSGRLEEARSLFHVARKLDPRSWDAALGMASYFTAMNREGNARAILEDPRIDRPAMYVAAAQSSKSLEKSDGTVDIPLESPDSTYEEAIGLLQSEPIATAADFVLQLDQSERDKMRCFIENLPPRGSYEAPPINTLTQFGTLQAISSPAGTSALADFTESVTLFTALSSARAATEQYGILESMGLKIELGFDPEDAAKNPEKYENMEPDVQVSGMEEFMANAERFAAANEQALNAPPEQQAAAIVREASAIDPFFMILRIDPAKYADPMNIVIQKQNFAAYCRKYNLYGGYLFSVNRRVFRQLGEIREGLAGKLSEAGEVAKIQNDQLDREEEEARARGEDVDTAAWKLRRHAIHRQYFQTCNNAATVAWTNATNIACVAYIRKIKPKAEEFYYDVIRHIGLISDPDVRDRKDRELRNAIGIEVSDALQNVLWSYSFIKYQDEWDCTCDIEALTRQAEEERKAEEREENERLARNMGEKKRFESGEIPQSSPLWKRLDAYGTDLSIPFIPFMSGRVSCARTVVNFDFTLPVPGTPQISAGYSQSAFSGATTYSGGVKIGLGAGGGSTKLAANLSLDGSVSVDGKGVVSDYSVTAGTDLSLSVGDTSLSAGGQMTFGPGGLRDSDFSAGISHDLSTEFGTSGRISFEASTTRGSSFSAKAEQTLEPAKAILDSATEETVGEHGAAVIPFDSLHTKEIWSGRYAL